MEPDRILSPLGHVVAHVLARARPLDLDDLSAKVSQRLPNPRSGQDASEFDDLQTFQGFAISQKPESLFVLAQGSAHAHHACPHMYSPFQDSAHDG